MQPAEPPAPTLAFVTVVFEAEIGLLELQARSLRAHLAPGTASAIVVLDNTARGLSRRTRARIAREYGPLEPLVSYVRTADLGVDGAVHGWRSQQAAKLLIARHVQTSHVVILDAKNHLIADAGVDHFVGADGVPRGGTHSYLEHPLRDELERTLRHLGADEAEISAAVADFPPTATPFVVDTDVVRALIEHVEGSAGTGFAEAFERAGLLEFFLYSGWARLHRPARPVVDGRAIPAPVIWPRRAHLEGVEATIAEVHEQDALWFAVHRRVLARGDRDTRRRIEAFWAERDLLTPREARAFVRRFRLRYAPLMAKTRAVEAVRRRLAS
jgi:hypothetical protein